MLLNLVCLWLGLQNKDLVKIFYFGHSLSLTSVATAQWADTVWLIDLTQKLGFSWSPWPIAGEKDQQSCTGLTPGQLSHTHTRAHITAQYEVTMPKHMGNAVKSNKVTSGSRKHLPSQTQSRTHTQS